MTLARYVYFTGLKKSAWIKKYYIAYRKKWKYLTRMPKQRKRRGVSNNNNDDKTKFLSV
jgi:hypothetical protein